MIKSNIDIKELFLKVGALLEGHFVLSSGLHSEFYMQSAKILQNPKNAEFLGNMIATQIKKLGIGYDLIVSPAMGGIIIGHEVARALGIDFLFTERIDSEMKLRRGFVISKKMKIVIVEDVFTTGKSTKEVIKLINDLGGQVTCCCSIVDRSGGEVNFSIPKISLLTLKIKNYEPSNCSLCKKGVKIQKPGSRFKK